MVWASRKAAVVSLMLASPLLCRPSDPLTARGSPILRSPPLLAPPTPRQLLSSRPLATATCLSPPYLCPSAAGARPLLRFRPQRWLPQTASPPRRLPLRCRPPAASRSPNLQRLQWLPPPPPMLKEGRRLALSRPPPPHRPPNPAPSVSGGLLCKGQPLGPPRPAGEEASHLSHHRRAARPSPQRALPRRLLLLAVQPPRQWSYFSSHRRRR